MIIARPDSSYLTALKSQREHGYYFYCYWCELPVLKVEGFGSSLLCRDCISLYYWLVFEYSAKNILDYFPSKSITNEEEATKLPKF